MALVRDLLARLKSSDGRIHIKTLSGVSVLVAAIALLVGVLPVMADHDPAGPLVNPVVVSYGGGSGACAATLDGRLPSVASREFHINNPQPGQYIQDGITVTVRDRTTLPAGRVFDFKVSSTSGFVVYDVIVNGGAQNNHYDYDTTYPDITPPPGPVDHDNNLSAPKKNNRSLYNLSHINICYDVPGLTMFACGVAEEVRSEGLFSIAEATIFANSVYPVCADKRGSFFIDNEGDEVTLAFEGDTGEKVAGRLEVTKDFTEDATPLNRTDFANLTYDGPGAFVELQWCNIRSKTTGDGIEFDDVLDPQDELAAADTPYPSLVGVKDGAADATACKVSEEENAAGIQVTVVYFEFEDPNFK